MSGTLPCRLLDWDTQFFGIRIGRLLPSRLTTPVLKQTLEWCRKESIACLYFLAASDDAQTIELAEAHRFRQVDIRVTLESKGDPQADNPKVAGVRPVRPSRPEDIPALKSIARSAYRDSRFYFDGRFPRERCDALYEAWIARSCEGWAPRVWVAEDQDGPTGFITCHLDKQGEGSVGLVGVAHRAQGRGMGADLLKAALNWFQERGSSCVTVVTQGRNVRAQRLYQRAGFVTSSVELWYHRWEEDRTGPDPGSHEL